MTQTENTEETIGALEQKIIHDMLKRIEDANGLDRITAIQEYSQFVQAVTTRRSTQLLQVFRD